MKVLIICDSFKNLISATEVNHIIASNLIPKGMDTECISLSDGGEGFLDCIDQFINLDRVEMISCDPLFRPKKVFYKVDHQTNTAYIELAICSGLQLLQSKEYNPLLCSTFGTGLQLKHAIASGVEKVVLGLGGSASHDLGIGILEAMDFMIENANHEKIRACGQNLGEIKYIKSSGLSIPEIELWTDVQNPLYGSNGAAYVYAAQKGANASAQDTLEQNTKSFSINFENEANTIQADGISTGAAGGTAYGLMKFLHAKSCSGIQQIIQLAKLSEKIQQAELIITGEGKFDKQSMQGKVTGEIIRLCQIHDKTCLLICGINENKASDIYAKLNVNSTFEHFGNLEKSLTFVHEGIHEILNNNELFKH